MTFFEIMSDTASLCQTDSKLKSSIQYSISQQIMYLHGCDIGKNGWCGHDNNRYVVSGQRSFEAAKKYKGKSIAVLNFANNRSIGGNPYYANAQEECLCRCSTLLSCLKAMKHDFYDYHRALINNGKLDYLGNDDIIYTPNVTVFKTDEHFPQLLPEEEWYNVNVITCAAPELWQGPMPLNYENLIEERLKRVLDIAAVNNNQIIILGAWGCGAYENPPEDIARIFYNFLGSYVFEVVEFAMGSCEGINYHTFVNTFRTKV